MTKTCFFAHTVFALHSAIVWKRGCGVLEQFTGELLNLNGKEKLKKESLTDI